ncbi:hypothetical protein PGTUg99_007272 [Puccinia graminis f. sp. tritici]|uniref:Uncharacterized protein n=1 Tax=Puccinia graminis f. sp. tritici TaxID=56615 RepID=A0A5B0RCC8_PUCGR|nr:hypothetical protein PGTUg99_007272 [Puccinia graminis f. sp. tritici]
MSYGNDYRTISYPPNIPAAKDAEGVKIRPRWMNARAGFAQIEPPHLPRSSDWCPTSEVLSAPPLKN